MQFIDSHCHLIRFLKPEERVSAIELARAKGCIGFVQGGIDPADWQSQLELKDKDVYRVFGIHPWVAAKSDLSALEEMLHSLGAIGSEAVAIGEIGLDFSKKCSGHEIQMDALRRQLFLAKKFQKPIVLHVVRAHDDVLRILREEKFEGAGIIVHSFGSKQSVAKAYLDLGAFLSLAPGLGEKNSEMIKYVPSNRILLESDSPDQLRQPADILEGAAVIANVLKIDLSLLLEQTTNNAKVVFHI